VGDAEGGLAVYAAVAAAAYFLGVLLGYIAPSERLVEEVQRGLGYLTSLHGLASAAVMYANNAAFAVLLELGSLLVLPGVMLLAFNGYVLGSLASVFLPEHGAGLLLAALLPHGVVELPAYMLAAGGGLQCARSIYRGGFSFERLAARCLGLLYPVLLLLLAAAFLEEYVTPRVVSAVVGG